MHSMPEAMVLQPGNQAPVSPTRWRLWQRYGEKIGGLENKAESSSCLLDHKLSDPVPQGQR